MNLMRLKRNGLTNVDVLLRLTRQFSAPYKPRVSASDCATTPHSQWPA
jgi:hypothetical protein